MNNILLTIARRIYPDLKAPDVSEIQRSMGMFGVFSLLYLAPIALIGLIWLVAVTDTGKFGPYWPLGIVTFAAIYALSRLGFGIEFELVDNVPGDLHGTLENIVVWGTALVIGPLALWIKIAQAAVDLLVRGWRIDRMLPLSPGAQRWNVGLSFVQTIAQTTVPLLCGLALYQASGGFYPLPGVWPDAVLRALLPTLAQSLIASLLIVPQFVFMSRAPMFAGAQRLPPIESAKLLGLTFMLMGVLPDSFAILLAGLYGGYGAAGYLFFVAGLILVGLLASQLSQSLRHTQQRSREIGRLEQLSRAQLSAPPDGSTLAELLKAHVPPMFMFGQISIRLFPDKTLLHHPDHSPALPQAAWDWLNVHPEEHLFEPGQPIPWEAGKTFAQPVLLIPITSEEDQAVLGGIYATQRKSRGKVKDLLPAVQSLAAQIASSLYRAKTHEQTLAAERMSQELTLAANIQESFLPKDLPALQGWRISVTLESARETSGDFFDLINLPGGYVGVVVADVADKGVAAALYMAVSRTLLRTYAFQYLDQPAEVLNAANRRILEDTQNNMFVTLFYGVVDPTSGQMTYSSAGHNPAYAISRDKTVRKFAKTGVPLGMFAESTWQQQTIDFSSGDVLLMYTDGLTEAQNAERDLFGVDRMLDITQSCLGQPIQDLTQALIDGVHTFVGAAPQFDDITLVVLERA